MKYLDFSDWNIKQNTDGRNSFLETYLGTKWNNAFSAKVTSKGIENIVFVLKEKTLEKINWCTKFAREQMPETHL